MGVRHSQAISSACAHHYSHVQADGASFATAELDGELAKMEYAQVCSSEHKKNNGNKSEGTIPDSEDLVVTKANNKKVIRAYEAAKLTVTMEVAKLFEVYGNLLSDKASQPWEKIIKAQVTFASWEDVYEGAHTKTPTTMCDLFCT